MLTHSIPSDSVSSTQSPTRLLTLPYLVQLSLSTPSLSLSLASTLSHHPLAHSPILSLIHSQRTAQSLSTHRDSLSFHTVTNTLAHSPILLPPQSLDFSFSLSLACTQSHSPTHSRAHSIPHSHRMNCSCTHSVLTESVFHPHGHQSSHSFTLTIRDPCSPQTIENLISSVAHNGIAKGGA